MNREEIQRVLGGAVELAESVPEMYRTTAFRIAAEALLRGRSAEVRDQPGSAAERGESPHPPQAVNETLALVRNRSHTDKFKVILFHALNTEGVEEVPLERVLAAYSSGRIARPANPSDIIGKCMGSGHVTEGGRQDSHRTWRLTGSGQRYVEELLREAASA